ncbi:ShlB/FhaC/HecB family hemolysin secretion/activation protein [Edwardsiella ictaluri]|uniref:ShlB/FhaC/HecB family hemolysin secretion/activation protein n=1 Tax=Edwardsiella ictaluri TaxID=67780 RepID=A0ABY8GIN7_EDWIC|nr:ShlB/FhaC/HecB family hemolysin secretion/activation protein [Edwardsiella ictaluri]ARD39364.1 ShlB/FhaC/HecB family hemolysin secretion/activation protein [Edwardsiella ictaluri]ELV7527631.1 ShlB/FhaC/HecB family hemolysin secretion/activation protein [Edwardsiella ictaluri]KMQ79071.1 ShlB/FhaC/HecB family hemolysin secretion/activation protein [Edwardsiella ictaluri]KOO55844.1 ShlB/FhaC/HecB family hemolysin secretion/activation protein [Edwardsiella ictaluri]QPW27786.1 ShlB/FhaC/HecB fam
MYHCHFFNVSKPQSTRISIILIKITLFLPASVLLLPESSQAAPATSTISQPLINQQQRQQALEQQITPVAPDIRFAPPLTPTPKNGFPTEVLCFPISQVRLSGTEALPHWLPLQHLANQAIGHCLGVKGINLLMARLQNRLIDHGWVTTQVLAPQQALTSGTLHLVILAGFVHDVRLTPDSSTYATLYTAFPAHRGNVLDLRDIEQGLENLQRLPTVSTSMDIVPGERPGESDIVIKRHQSRLWRVDASLDNSGATSTGKYLGMLTASLDNPLSLSDLFYLSGSHNLDGNGSGKSSESLTAHYSVPFGYWLMGATASRYNYVQTVAGLNGDYQYSGNSKDIDIQVSYLLHRNSNQKTTLTADVMAREQHNVINDTEIDVQRRQTAAWKLGLQHRHYIGSTILDAGMSYQRGTRWLGASPAPEEFWGEATALSKILQMSAQLTLPFSVAEQHFQFNTHYFRQMSNTPLTPPDMLSIGNRWTVRGFDGERTLTASHGWYVRNTLAWATPLPAQELYIGADYGEVGGRGEETLVGNHLAGGVVGLRGQYRRAGYDLFAGTPLSKPDGLKTDSVTVGFSLNWSY